MKKIVLLFFVFFISISYAQSTSQLAYDYFRKGEYNKAMALYEELYKKNDRSRVYFKNLLSCYRELEDFEKSETLISNQIKKTKQAYLLVEKGYNYQLQNQKEKAITFYDTALKSIEKNTSSAYLIGRAFKENHLLDYALKVYKKAGKLKANANFSLNIALIYGEKGEMSKMFEAYLDMLVKNPKSASTVQRYVGRFVTDDSQNSNNILFRRAVLKRLQNNPNNSWNKLLSWLYMQQKDYNKALIQEKAVYRRNQENLPIIFNLAKISFEDKNYDTAKKAYLFIIEKASNVEDVLHAENQLLLVKTAIAQSEEEYLVIEQKYKELFEKYGTNSFTIKTQLNYANYLVFTKNNLTEAISILKHAKTIANSKYILGDIKLQLADILVFDNKFNQALVTYTQVQSDLKGSDIAQTARLKVAQTSYYKGDFDWAIIQLKVLKSATSKLISNDALKLNLLIGDNIAGDTIRLALKKYAKADILSYQNKPKQAIDTLEVLLRNFKGHAIEDEALLKQAELLEEQKLYELAANNYHKIIQIKKEGILVDNAYFALGRIYTLYLKDTEKAMKMYQEIIFNYANSIFLVDARKNYRKLRGDQLDN